MLMNCLSQENRLRIHAWLSNFSIKPVKKEEDVHEKQEQIKINQEKKANFRAVE